MPKSLLFVTISLDLGGAERHLALIAPRLKTLGWKPEIYCLWRRGQQAAALEDQGITVSGPDRAIPRDASVPSHAFQLTRSAWNLLWHLRKERPQVVHFFLPGPYLIGAPLAMLAGIPVKVMSRRSLNLYQRNHPLSRILEPFLHKRMTAILGNSRRVVRNLIEEEGCARDQVGLIHNGVELPVSSAAQADEAAPLDGPGLKLVTVANLIAYKGHADLLRALASIRHDLPPKWELLCVGRDDGAGKDIARLAAELDIASHVRLPGERKDIAALLGNADIGILASHQEGFSNAVLEGMAARLPMVVTDVGGNPDAVIDGETGFVVPPRDPRALASAIHALAGDAEVRRKMGAAGRKRAETEFSLETCVERYDRLYRALLAGKPVSSIEGIALHSSGVRPESA